MALIPSRTIAEVYINLLNTGRALRARLPGYVTLVGSPYSAQSLRSNILPYLRAAATVYPASGNFPQAWKDALATHANAQTGGSLTTAEYVTQYDAVGDAIRAALAAAIATIPVDSQGRGLMIQINPDDGGETWVTLPADADIAAALSAVVDALS